MGLAAGGRTKKIGYDDRGLRGKIVLQGGAMLIEIKPGRFVCHYVFLSWLGPFLYLRETAVSSTMIA